MAEHGARSLVFVNRSGLAKEDAKSTVKELEDKGVQVMVHACDISDETQAQRMVIDTSRCAPPVRGVIQGAMILKASKLRVRRSEDGSS